ncbi:MAG: HAD hydrolase-like protein [Roseobacter sp.]|jgi:HAD superfamily hydrolase (TIGR01450 family)
MMNLTATEAFAAYEDARARLPRATPGKPAPRRIGTLLDIADAFDVFLLDAFGVLNIGETAIDGVPERVRALQDAGKRIIVVSNAASVPRDALLEKYRRLGYEFAPHDIVTSRMATIAGLSDASDFLWGIMGLSQSPMDDFSPLDWRLLEDDAQAYQQVEGFLLVGSGEWSQKRQDLLESALAHAPRPVCVANPDIVAPRETGFSTEPGYFAHKLAEHAGVSPTFYGKPFRNIYDLAFDVLRPVDRTRVAMVGDSLHTDILGAHTAGIASVLVSDYGFFAGEDALHAIERSGITPDFVARQP